jgi:drug/metabolite transporter (DMT)-like permease
MEHNTMNKRSISKGILYIVISAFCFALMNLFISLSGELPFVQKSFFRNLIAFIAALFFTVQEETTD